MAFSTRLASGGRVWYGKVVTLRPVVGGLTSVAHGP